MQNWLKLDGTMRAVASAIGAAIVTAVIAMLVPVGLWETITGSTGISEILPATAAPLGDTARALIAFLSGLLAFALTAVLMMRNDKPKKSADTHTDNIAAPADAKPSLFDRAKLQINDMIEKRRNRVVVTELSDLPKLRAGDAHPDAPPRRPISAHTDFAEVAPEAAPLPAPLPAPEVSAKADDIALPAVAVNKPVPEMPQPVAAPTETIEPEAVSAMVDRLESAVALREQQLAKLEAIARSESTKPVMATDEPVVKVVPAPRASHLEAVPSELAKPVGSDAMDAALRSALETLHRMNARTR
jgi:hypothetical protein